MQANKLSFFLVLSTPANHAEARRCMFHLTYSEPPCLKDQVFHICHVLEHQIRTYSLPLDQRRQFRRRIQAQVAAATPASADECWRIFLWEKMKQKRHTALI
jgi:hypothetical protein